MCNTLPLQVAVMFDELCERHRNVAELRQEVRGTSPLAAPVCPTSIDSLDEVVAGLTILDVVGGESLHLDTEGIGLSVEVVEVSIADTRNDLNLLVRRDLTAQERVLVGVDDDTEPVIPIRERVGKEGDAERGRELSLMTTDIEAGFPGTVVPSVLSHCVPFRICDCVAIQFEPKLVQDGSRPL